MLDIFKNIKENAVSEKVPELVNVDIVNSPLINTVFRDRIQNIDKMTDRELYNLLKNSYETLFSDIFIKNDIQYLNMFTNSRFLNMITQIMGEVQISYINRIYCNKIVYDYLAYDNSDEYIKSLMLNFSRVVNRDIIPIIVGIGIPENIATELVIARYSSMKELVNVKRLNFVITSSLIDIMTEQTIVFIYEKLFNKMTPLFEGIMFDVYECETEESEEIYSRISLAVLDILNGMTSADIRKVLISYSSDYTMLFVDNGVRFSMNSLSYDFERINNIVEQLKQENIYLP